MVVFFFFFFFKQKTAYEMRISDWSSDVCSSDLEWVYAALSEEFPGCRFYSFAEDHVQKQESFDLCLPPVPEPSVITEHGLKFLASPGSGHTTGFFADQRDNSTEERGVGKECVSTRRYRGPLYR